MYNSYLDQITYKEGFRVCIFHATSFSCLSCVQHVIRGLDSHPSLVKLNVS